MNEKKKIEIIKLYLIFGRERNKAFKMLMKGKSKWEIKKETGCIIAVNGANFAINEGEIFVIMGLSGSGKSSLLRCINRLDKPILGAIVVNGSNIVTMTDEELRTVRRKNWLWCSNSSDCCLTAPCGRTLLSGLSCKVSGKGT